MRSDGPRAVPAPARRTGDAMLHTEELMRVREAAVLFAARFDVAARQLLEEEIASSGARAGDTAVTMLFEILHLLGLRAEFDALAARCRTGPDGATPPAWGFPAQVAAPGTFELEGTIASPGALAGLVAHAHRRNTVAVDMGRVERIDFGFGAAFGQTLQVFHHQGKRVILANIAEVHAAMLESLGADHHVVLLRRRALARTIAAVELRVAA